MFPENEKRITETPKARHALVHHQYNLCEDFSDAIINDPKSAPIATPISKNPRVSEFPPSTLFAIAGIRTMLGKQKKPVEAIRISRYRLGSNFLAIFKPSTVSFKGLDLLPSFFPIGGRPIFIFFTAKRVEE